MYILPYKTCSIFIKRYKIVPSISGILTSDYISGLSEKHHTRQSTQEFVFFQVFWFTFMYIRSENLSFGIIKQFPLVFVTQFLVFMVCVLTYGRACLCVWKLLLENPCIFWEFFYLPGKKNNYELNFVFSFWLWEAQRQALVLITASFYILPVWSLFAWPLTLCFFFLYWLYLHIHSMLPRNFS